MSNNKIKIFIVDDSAYVRNYLKSNLKDTFEIVDEARDGIEALKKIYNINPDIIILDLMMPKMGGDAVAKAIMSTKPTPIIIFTSLTDEEIKKSFNLMENTITDIIKKPVEFNEEFIDKLIRKIQLVSKLQANKIIETIPQPVNDCNNLINKNNFICTIGVSTGGPKTLRAIIPYISSIKNFPIVLIQHMDSDFENGYINWLSDFANKDIYLLNNDTVLEDKIYVCSPKFNLEISCFSGKIKVKTTLPPPTQIYFPSIDNILTNFAYNFKDKLIHIQLTGLGNDGQKGANVAKSLGAKILCENPENAIANSMPKAVLDLADYVFDLPEISNYLLRILDKK